MEEMLPPSLQKEPILLTRWFQTLASRTVREYMPVVLSLWFVVRCVAAPGNEYSLLWGAQPQTDSQFLLPSHWLQHKAQTL